MLNIKNYLCKQKRFMVEEVGNTGTRATGILLFGGELSTMLFDMRWMLLLIGVLIIADYRLGCEESKMHYLDAKAKGNELLCEQNKFRRSRARRKTANKFIDYMIYVIVGISFGKALLPQLHLDYIWGGWVATAIIAILIELPSSLGHFFYVRGVIVKKKTIEGFLRAFFVALVKKKSDNVGNALEEGFKATEEGK